MTEPIALLRHCHRTLSDRPGSTRSQVQTLLRGRVVRHRRASRDRAQTVTRRSGPAVIAVGVIVGGSLLLGACGSSTASSTASSNAGTVAASGACTQVSAALSDGPDPDADPIGYAQAQILPLHQISTSNDRLRTDIDGLAVAYQAVVATNNSAAAKQAVARASNKVDALCPGVTS